MRNVFRYSLTAIMLLALGLAPISAQAIDVVSDKNVSVPAEKTIEDDLAAAGETIDMAGTINGNLYAGGSTITVVGPVTGGLHAAGSEVTLSGPVNDDVWAAGGTLTVHSAVAHNLGLAGGTVTLGPEAMVGRDAMVAGGQIMVDCPIGRNLNIGASTAVVSGHISGDVEAYVDKLTLTRTAVVEHDVTVYSPNPPEIEPGAQVKGTVHYHPTERAQRRTPFQSFRSWMSGWLTHCASVLLLGFVLLYLLPTQTARVTEILGRRSGQALLYGSGAMILVPLGTLLITASLIGIPLAVCIGALYVMALLVAVVPCAYFAGTVLSNLSRKHSGGLNRWATFALGALFVTFITSLPHIGGIAEGILLTMGSGALILYLRDLIREAKK